MTETPKNKEPRNQKTEEIDKHWQSFLTLYPDNESCWKDLHNMQLGAGTLSCINCFAKDSVRKDGERTAKCSGCGKTIWITAGTFFHRVRNLHAVFGAIWLIQNGQVVSSLYLSKLAGTAQSTALNTLKSIYFVIDQSLTGTFEDIGSLHFMGMFFKRSKQTPKKEHPLNEESSYDEKSDPDFAGPIIDFDNDSQTVMPSMSEQEEKIHSVLLFGPNSVDVIQNLTKISMSELLICLSMLEMRGIIKTAAGGKFAVANNNAYTKSAKNNTGKSRRSASSCHLASCCGATAKSAGINLLRVERTVGKVFAHVCQMIHGLSRKYLQLYLALFSFTYNLKGEARPSLFAICLGADYVTKETLDEYVTPLNVRLVKAAA